MSAEHEGLHMDQPVQPVERYKRHPTMPGFVIDLEHPDAPPITVGEAHADYLTGWGRELARARMIQQERPKRSLWRWFKGN